MPKSRRDRKVSLTRTPRKGLEAKQALITEKLFGYEMAEFKVTIKFVWNSETGDFQKLVAGTTQEEEEEEEEEEDDNDDSNED
ncbi:hypothetical protein WISP_48229 [Willisornis vidua]|uniref:Uncharacterized protein n=1 Tax=Willisornis vidua TaxID=1566151 RepID=A0ABQ9DEI6_9PASS|nr:hypothetical protein WISP_48229 [Willisornis vidua]